MCRLHRAASNIERRADNAIRTDPLQREHGADDVDDRVEGANFVQVHALDGRLMNRRLGFGEPLEERLCAAPTGRRKRRLVDERTDVLETPMRMIVMIAVAMVVVAIAAWRRVPPAGGCVLRAGCCMLTTGDL